MAAINKIPRGLRVLLVMAIMAILIWRFAYNTNYYYYGIGIAILITIGVILVVYHTPRIAAKSGEMKSVIKSNVEEQPNSEDTENTISNGESDSENISIEADYTDSPSILRDKPSSSFRSIAAKPQGAEVAANYMKMSRAASEDNVSDDRQSGSKFVQTNNEFSKIIAENIPESGEPPMPLIEDESALAEEDKNELVNAVWYRCENPYCKYTRFLSVHHIVDEKDGGTNKLDNLIVLCPYCHALAHSNDIPEKEMRDWISNREERFKFKPQWHYH